MNNYFMETHHHEWILSNSKGSYALGTGNLINQRKYHGLLVASDAKFNRRHLVAGMEEKIEWRGEIIHLDSNNYSNCIYPEGFLYLVKPWLRPYPIFLYSALPHQNEILILKEIMMDEETNTSMVKYTNLGHHRLHFHLHPKYTLVPHHELNYPGNLDHEQFDTGISRLESGVRAGCQRGSNAYQVYTHSLVGEIEHNKYVYYNVYYPWEVMSGYAGIGDQISLFEISFDLGVGESNYVLFSDQPLEQLEPMIERIEARYRKLPKPKDYPNTSDQDDTLISRLDYEDSKLFNYEQHMAMLDAGLKAFVANDDIIAGYPYYGAWGRDTMFVLNALLHRPDNVALVERILKKYAEFIKEGLIPNVLPESGRELNYDTVDATMWYIILLWKLGKVKNTKLYWKNTLGFLDELLGTIISQSTYPFHIREDGLLVLDPGFAHATWMDVRIDGVAVTPRNGAPVEINALWFNALKVYQDVYTINQRKRPLANTEQIMDVLAKLEPSMEKFWSRDYLADCLICHHNGVQCEEQVTELRPNALIALSLPFSFLDQDRMLMVFEKAYKELYTFYGIRTLSPQDPKFKKKYYGSQRDRDLAFHNGSVWAWLLSPFCGVYSKAMRGKISDAELADKLESLIEPFRTSCQKGHIASIAEVWDGDNPHFPKGAPALAMSVAALFNVESYIAYLRGNL